MFLTEKEFQGFLVKIQLILNQNRKDSEQFLLSEQKIKAIPLMCQNVCRNLLDREPGENDLIASLELVSLITDIEKRRRDPDLYDNDLVFEYINKIKNFH